MKQRLALFSLAALVLAACGSDDAVSIEGAWARTSAAGQTTGAIYFDVTVDADDTLVSADVPDAIADRAEIHEVVMADVDASDMDSSMGDESDAMDDTDEMEGSNDMEDSDGMDGAMTMQELTDGLELAGGETVSFEPGGYHVMLLDIAEPLEVGDEIELTLEFAAAGATTLTVEVAESAP